VVGYAPESLIRSKNRTGINLKDWPFVYVFKLTLLAKYASIISLENNVLI